MVQLDHFCIDCNNVIGTMVVESSITQGLAPPKRVHLQILNESVEEGVKRKLSLLQKSVGGMHDKVMKLAAVSVHLFELTEGGFPPPHDELRWKSRDLRERTNAKYVWRKIIA